MCVTVQIYMVVQYLYMCVTVQLHGCTVLVHVCYCTIRWLYSTCTCVLLYNYTCIYTCVTCVIVLWLCSHTDVRAPITMIVINLVTKWIGLHIAFSVCLCWGQWLDFAICSDHAIPGVETDIPNGLQHVRCLDGQK